MTPVLVKRKDVEKIVGMGYTTFSKLEKEGKFPRRRQITPGRVGWVYAELEDWARSLQ